MKAWQLVKKGWCQGAYARTANNRAVGYAHKEATNFSADGAIRRAYKHSPDMLKLLFLFSDCLKKKGFDPVVHKWNDEFTGSKHEVVDMLRIVEEEFLRSKKKPQPTEEQTG